jgi:nucleoid-associated protein YgaU
MHRVVDGDSLPKLAERYLGDERRAGEILEANRDILVHPDLLPLGVRLRIPTSP